MSEKIRSAGYYELPIPIVVTDDVLGTVCPTRIGGLAALIHTPLPVPGAGDSPARPPLMPGVPADPPRVPSPWDWVVAFDDAPTAAGGICLRRVGVVLKDGTPVTTEPAGEGTARVSRLGAPAPVGMDRWVASLRTWVEVVTEQDLDQYYPRFDASYLGAGLWISDDLIPDTGLRHIEPMTFTQWQALLQRIADDVQPALEHLIARDARAQFQRGDHLRCAISLASAAEVALYRRCRDNPGVVGQAGAAAVDGSLLSLWAALVPAGLVPGARRDDMVALTRARDAAVRDGAATPADALQQLVRTISTLLNPPGHDPLFPAR